MSHPEPDLTFTVIIPAFNSAQFIAQTLDSVLAQSYPALEILVVDDGSTDDTAQIVRSFGGNVILIQQSHNGVSAARNLGILNARGNTVAFLDSDDLWKPEKLEKQAACFERKNVAWVCCGASFFDNKTGKLLPGHHKPLFEGDVLEKEFLYSFIRSPTPAVRKSVFDEVGLFDKTLRIAEDWDMWLRIAAVYPLGTVYENLALKREHKESTMQRTSTEDLLAMQISVIDKAIARQPERLGSLKNQLAGKIYMNHGIRCTKRGEYQDARKYFHQASTMIPGSLKLQVYLLVLSSGDRIANMLFQAARKFRGTR
jgi:glycosyltransferase involved in cell wall biosynthesis